MVVMPQEDDSGGTQDVGKTSRRGHKTGEFLLADGRRRTADSRTKESVVVLLDSFGAPALSSVMRPWIVCCVTACLLQIGLRCTSLFCG